MSSVCARPLIPYAFLLLVALPTACAIVGCGASDRPAHSSLDSRPELPWNLAPDPPAELVNFTAEDPTPVIYAHLIDSQPFPGRDGIIWLDVSQVSKPGRDDYVRKVLSLVKDKTRTDRVRASPIAADGHADHAHLSDADQAYGVYWLHGEGGDRDYVADFYGRDWGHGLRYSVTRTSTAWQIANVGFGWVE